MRRHKKQKLREATDKEAEIPESNAQNVWIPEFGWVMRYGKFTRHMRAYLKAAQRKVK